LSFEYLGNFSEAKDLFDKGLRFARNINHLPSLGLIETMYGYLSGHRGNGNNAIKYFKNSVKHMEEGQVLVMLGFAWCGLGWGYYLLGELQTARKYVEKGKVLISI